MHKLIMAEISHRNFYLSGYITELLELSLKNNDFLFNNEWFLQISGTAMGVDYAPHYADIYVTVIGIGLVITHP